MQQFEDSDRPGLFQSIRVGDVELTHRVVLAPMTRCRANDHGIHTDLAVEYYRQRASMPGTLLITEPSYVSRPAEGVSPHAPGVYTSEQIAAWKRVADAVHERGSYIFMQLWACGRTAELEYLRKRYPDYQYVSASDIPMAGRDEKSRPLTKPEIQEYVSAFAEAAQNAVKLADFDGVEIHGAYGYLHRPVHSGRVQQADGRIWSFCRKPVEICAASRRRRMSGDRGIQDCIPDQPMECSARHADGRPCSDIHLLGLSTRCQSSISGLSSRCGGVF
ncbi:FMN-linked oxidoreductase [Polyporus arcularius HHB13444]|uniref:FMN-linked oxidoreductase n=1 Tax=Polyporus arcularius HHB13444 TaxID=1314778 RepID=A0A5C3PN06_9APHY|nr:FMN-linked oxidoreductase [Polyporus arcularius HHB13444]